MKSLRDVVVIIPSLNPDAQLETVVSGLQTNGFTRILLVDDGSREDCRPIFDRLRQNPACTVLEHKINRGKGCALKTAFTHYLSIQKAEELVGVVTADADGQHLPEDIRRTAQVLLEHPDSLVLGTRNFNAENVPPKSRGGNKITTQVFRVLYGKTVHDTQTGLRGIPGVWLSACLGFAGERFEYEINMLVEAVRQKVPIQEVSIKTVYFHCNRETHFRPVVDSLKIYRIMMASFLRFSCSALASALLDQGLFAFLQKVVFAALPMDAAIWSATAAARLISSLFNYTLNRRTVFHSNERHSASLARYYLLCVSQLVLSALGVTALHSITTFDPSVIKLVVDAILFFISYRIQDYWVFRK